MPWDQTQVSLQNSFMCLLLELRNSVPRNQINEVPYKIILSLEGRAHNVVMGFWFPNIRQMREGPEFPKHHSCEISTPTPTATPTGHVRDLTHSQIQSFLPDFGTRISPRRWERIWEISAPRVIFPRGCHKHLKTGVYNGSGIANCDFVAADMWPCPQIQTL